MALRNKLALGGVFTLASIPIATRERSNPPAAADIQVLPGVKAVVPTRAVSALPFAG